MFCIDVDCKLDNFLRHILLSVSKIRCLLGFLGRILWCTAIRTWLSVVRASMVAPLVVRSDRKSLRMVLDQKKTEKHWIRMVRNRPVTTRALTPIGNILPRTFTPVTYREPAQLQGRKDRALGLGLGTEVEINCC